MKLTNLTHHHLWRTRVAIFMALALLAALAQRAEAISPDFGQIKGAVVATGIKSTKLAVTCCTHKFHYTEAASPGSAFAPPIQGVQFTITHDAEDPVTSGKGREEGGFLSVFNGAFSIPRIPEAGEFETAFDDVVGDFTLYGVVVRGPVPGGVFHTSPSGGIFDLPDIVALREFPVNTFDPGFMVDVGVVVTAMGHVMDHPESSTVMLLGSGLVGWVVWRKKIRGPTHEEFESQKTFQPGALYPLVCGSCRASNSAKLVGCNHPKITSSVKPGT